MDMNVKHTPGPWASYPCNLEAYSRVITAKGCMVQIAHTGVREKVAMTKEVYGDRMTYGPFEETTANALLIVAAPDLLDVLLRMTEYADDGTPIHPSDNLMAEARAAVAKAVGAA